MGEALVGMKRRGSQLLRQNMVPFFFVFWRVLEAKGNGGTKSLAEIMWSSVVQDGDGSVRTRPSVAMPVQSNREWRIDGWEECQLEETKKYDQYEKCFSFPPQCNTTKLSCFVEKSVS